MTKPTKRTGLAPAQAAIHTREFEAALEQLRKRCGQTIAELPEEAFSRYIAWAIAQDGFGGYRPESRDALLRMVAAAEAYYAAMEDAFKHGRS